MPIIVCTPRTPTPKQAEVAVRRSIELNPANAETFRTVERTPTGRRGGPRRLAVLIGSRWPQSCDVLSVQFVDSPSMALRKRILEHMNAWTRTVRIRFEETRETGVVRIARYDTPPAMAGYWSWVGTQVLGLADGEPTMNLEGFTMRTPESEFRRVVRHEAGHTLGFEHEHMRTDLVGKIDRKKAFAYYDENQGWSRQETIEQVLTPLSKASIMGTAESDPLSIMCYQVPASITKNRVAITGGVDINEKDLAFAGSIYPKKAPRAAPTRPTAAAPASPGVEASAPRGSAAILEPDAFHIVIMNDFNPDSVGVKSSTTAASSKPQPPTQKYARVFASYGGARVSSAMRLRKGKGEPPTPFGKIIATHARIQKYANREEGSPPSEEELVEFGSQLFDTLFQGDVKRLYDEARARQRNRKLDLVLTSMIPWIAEKPWEFAYDKARQSFLATEDIHLLRNVLTAIPAEVIPAERRTLRILVAAAQPVGLGHLSITEEVEVIRRGFEALIEAGLVTVEVLARTTPGRIHARLSTGDFNVVHFIGHGTFDPQKQEGALVFEDDRGGQLILGERPVREIFCQRGVSLVFLNACQSGSGGRADFNKGLAQALVAHGLPALVANQYSVLDSSATSFAQQFYWALAQGMSIGQAACESRIAVNYSMQGELIDWAVPVVYARDPGMSLCFRPAKLAPPLSTAVRPTSRRANQVRQVRVAAWDIDNGFPSLERTLERMNRSQTVFGFDLVALSAPIDAWDLEHESPDGKPYLWAEKLARRLARVTVELRVDVLACITRHWLRDDDWLNLYGWWPGAKKPPVVILSCAGFADLAAQGADTDRAIANLTVTAMAGFLTGMDAHERGSRSCPMAFNAKRDLGHLTRPQKFDLGCHTKLKSRIPGELAALETILKAF